jgi:hypothetical protein
MTGMGKVNGKFVIIPNSHNVLSVDERASLAGVSGAGADEGQQRRSMSSHRRRLRCAYSYKMHSTKCFITKGCRPKTLK